MIGSFLEESNFTGGRMERQAGTLDEAVTQ
jgi:hypothetical protein